MRVTQTDAPAGTLTGMVWAIAAKLLRAWAIPAFLRIIMQLTDDDQNPTHKPATKTQPGEFWRRRHECCRRQAFEVGYCHRY
jgi:hypothetical protein